jgi:hypothetical protein
MIDMKYALVNPEDEVVEIKFEDAIPSNQLTGQGMKAGWRWLVVNEIENDTSTSPYKIYEAQTVDVQANEVIITRTIRDATTQEANVQKNELVNRELTTQNIALARGLKLALNALFFVMNEERVARGAQVRTLAQFQTGVNSLNDISDAEMINWLKGLI